MSSDSLHKYIQLVSLQQESCLSKLAKSQSEMLKVPSNHGLSVSCWEYKMNGELPVASVSLLKAIYQQLEQSINNDVNITQQSNSLFIVTVSSNCLFI